MRPIPLSLSVLLTLLASSLGVMAGTVTGVKSVVLTNTQDNWFYIEEVEILNDGGDDVASVAFGTTATTSFGPAFGSNATGFIDDVFAACCGTGTHSPNELDNGVTMTMTFPSAQTLTGDITMWNRQDGCCPERLDGFKIEFFAGDDGGGQLLAEAQIDNLAADNAATISTPAGASFPVPGSLADGDGDGLPDDWETANGLDPDDNGEDPNNNGVPGNPDNGATGDPDADMLTNEEEFLLGTDPQEPDTDMDGLNDNVETDDGNYVDQDATGTDPLNDDTDGDGLLDGVENPDLPYDPNDAANQPGTSPVETDSDGDGFGDDQEIALGSDPTDMNSTPAVPSGAINGVRSVRITNTRTDWFYIEEIEILNSLNQDVASVTFGSTAATADWGGGPGFGSTTQGAIDDVFGACCGTGTHSNDEFSQHKYTVTFPAPQNLQGDITMWNRQDGCCPERLDGMFFEYFSGPDGTGTLLGSQQVDNLAADSAGGISSATGASFPIAGPITPPRVELAVSLDADELIFTWDSKAGKLYNLRSEVPGAGSDPGNLANDPLTWPIFGGNENIAATPSTNTLAIPVPAELLRLFVVEEFDAPPTSVFADDFESGQGAWEFGGDSGPDPFTNWELGTPDGAVVGGPASANSGANCWGTNIAALYENDADIYLRSPPIDLTTAGGATLNFSQWTDIEVMFDLGIVSILDATDDSVLAVLLDPVEGSNGTWEPVSLPLPPEAVGKVIKVEFRFQSDNFGNQAGWYVDDINFTVP